MLIVGVGEKGIKQATIEISEQFFWFDVICFAGFNGGTVIQFGTSFKSNPYRLATFDLVMYSTLFLSLSLRKFIRAFIGGE
ncbi:MAG: hypothetical protein RR285_10015 [Acinetobacter sp.]